jgi:hypothetical protein
MDVYSTELEIWLNFAKTGLLGQRSQSTVFAIFPECRAVTAVER